MNDVIVALGVSTSALKHGSGYFSEIVPSHGRRDLGSRSVIRLVDEGKKGELHSSSGSRKYRGFE